MSEDVMLQEAIEAIRQGQNNRARDLLTRLLRTDQANPVYWLWMSSVVESTKEQVYCLETVLRLDPENKAAKMGLVLKGALPPDENVVPVPPKRRKWDVDVEEEPPRRGLRAIWANPLVRVLAFTVIGIVVVVLILVGIYGSGPRAVTTVFRPTKTPGPPPTFTATPTFIRSTRSARGTPTPSRKGPEPLWMILEATYTPTPLYVNTPHAVIEAYRAGLRAFVREDWEKALGFFLQAGEVDPSAADIQYYVGEALRLMGDLEAAVTAYDLAISIDPTFAPAYLGRARASLALEPLPITGLIRPENEQVEDDFREAIDNDPNFGETYLERAAYYLTRGNPEAALEDLEAAGDLSPESPLLYMYQAQAALSLGEDETALETARQALELDQTLLPVYLTLGRAALLNGEFDAAKEALQTYLLYQEEDALGWLALGRAYAEIGHPEQAGAELIRPGTSRKYQDALEAFDQALTLNDELPGIYLYRGLAYLALDEGQKAINDIITARRSYSGQGSPTLTTSMSFAINLGLGRALLAADRLGEGYLQIDGTQTLAETDEQLAALYYWRALALEALDNAAKAEEDWQSLLELPEESVPEMWVAIAEEHIAALHAPTPTITPTPSATGDPTETPATPQTVTPTITLEASSTPSPTTTPTPSPNITPTP